MNALVKNWQPTVGGILTALGLILPAFGVSAEVASAIAAAGAAFLGITAKQHNVTGGTKEQ